MPWSWPVDVNYHEAKAYCAWKSEKDGLRGSEAYRLITEAEHHLIRHPEQRPEHIVANKSEPAMQAGRL